MPLPNQHAAARKSKARRKTRTTTNRETSSRRSKNSWRAVSQVSRTPLKTGRKSACASRWSKPSICSTSSTTKASRRRDPAARALSSTATRAQRLFGTPLMTSSWWFHFLSYPGISHLDNLNPAIFFKSNLNGLSTLFY